MTLGWKSLNEHVSLLRQPAKRCSVLLIVSVKDETLLVGIVVGKRERTRLSRGIAPRFFNPEDPGAKIGEQLCAKTSALVREVEDENIRKDCRPSAFPIAYHTT
jgi:hypothetical protein